MRTAYGSSPIFLSLALVVVSAGAGCDSHSSLRNGGSGGAGPMGGTTTGPITSGGAGSGGMAGGGGMAGSGGRTGSGGGSGGTTPMCYADFPCQGSYRCTGAGYQPTETRDCHSVCGSGPCSGATCASVGAEVACPAGTHCVSGASDVTRACQPDAPDAATKDAGADVPVKDAAVDGDAPGSDALKMPLDVAACREGSTTCVGQAVQTCEGGAWRAAKDCALACSNGACTGDCKPGAYQCQGATIQKCNTTGSWENVTTCSGTCVDAQCVETCTAGQQRCKDLVPQACSAARVWQDNRACLYLCSGGTCSGECTPGSRRCRESTAQTCSTSALWVDQQACTGDTATCVGGQCVGSCVDAGQDCTDTKTSCCPGSECASTDGKTFTCRAIAACGALGKTCATTADCCAGLDCTSGKCATRSEACLEKAADGLCDPASSGTCCPGTTCRTDIVGSGAACAIPSTTKPQDTTCLRDRPSQHEACSAARFGLTCTYSDWVNEPGIFYVCTCSYHGWSCEKNYYVR